MPRLERFLLWIGLVVLLVACSSKDNSEPPALLTEIERPIPLEIRWSTDTDAVDNTRLFNLRPLLIDDQILSIDTAGEIKNIDAKSGRESWSFESNLAAITGLAGNRQVIVVSSGDGDLAVFDRVDGGLEKRWSIQLTGEIRAIPAIGNEQLFVRTVAGKLSAVSLADGSIQWTISRRIPALSLTGNSPPLIDGSRLIVGFDDGKLTAFDRSNGQTIWETVISHATGRTEIERLVDIDGQFLLKDGIVYVSTYQGRLSAVQAIDGNVIWSRKFSSYQSIIADEDALYITGDFSHLWAIDRRTGSAFWKQEALHARKITAPQLLGNKIVVADLEGYVHWFDKSDGSLRGRIRSSESSHVAQPLSWQNNAVVFDSEGRLSLISAK